MVKQTKTFKKGNVTKKALSAILAASMVMTSSSFVMAAPVEVEDVAVEVAAVEEVAGVEEAEPTAEENVAEATDIITFKDKEFTFTGSPFTYNESSIPTGLANAFNTIKVKRAHSNGKADDEKTLSFLIDTKTDGTNIHHYTVKVVDTVTKKEYVLTDSTALANELPTAVGTYDVIISGNSVVGPAGGTTEGTITSQFTINDDKSQTITPEFNSEKTDKNVYYTGSECKPSLKLTMGTGDRAKTLTEGTDYEIVGYSNNVNYNNSEAAKVKVLYKGLFASRGEVEYGFNINKAVLTKTNTVITINNPKVVYNGKEQKADVEVKFTPDGATAPVVLKEGTDYTLENGKQTNVAKYENVTVNFNTLNFNATALASANTVTFEITALDFNETALDVTVSDVYVGKSSTPAVVVKDKTTGQVINSGYTVLYGDSQGRWNAAPVEASEDNAGKTFAVKITANATNFKAGSITKNYKIVDLKADTLANYIKREGYSLNAPANSAPVANTANEFEYSVNGVVPSITIAGHTYTNGETYNNIKVTYPEAKDCKALGEYKIKLEPKDVWTDNVEISYKVVPQEITGISELTNSIAVYKTTKGNTYAKVSLVDKQTLAAPLSGNYTLVNGTDYDYQIVPNFANSANADVVINFKGNYKGTVTVDDQRVSVGDTVPLDSDAITAVVTKNYVYDSAAKMPKAEDILVTAHIDGKDVVLTPGYDYEINESFVNPNFTAGYKDNIKVGEASVGIKAKTGTNRCSGERVVKFQITATETEKENYIVDTSALKAVYEKGTEFTPSVIVKTKAGRVLAAGEYDVKYYRDGKEVASNAEAFGKTAKAGTVTMKVTINATKTDVLETSYRIATSLDKVTTIPSEIKDQVYTGSAIEPEIKLTRNNTTIALEEGKDYTVTYASNVEIGTAVVTIQGIGEYYGTYVRTFKIVSDGKQTIEVLAAQERDLGNGSRTLNSKATKIKYTAKTAVTFESSDENVVTVDAEGNVKYTGIGEATITIKAAAENGYKEATKELKVVVKLAKPSFTPFSKNNAFTLTSSTVKGAEKFEVQYATKKDFSNKKSVKFTATSGKVRQVKVSAADKKTYYVRVRAISGTETSAWSTTKTVATK